MTIPASRFVKVLPSVLGAGGAALVLSGLILTNNTAVPIGTVSQFSTPAAVSAFFGPTSTEAILAAIYFAGYTNATQLPGNILFSQYASAPVSAYLRSANLASMTLAQLQAIPAGVLTLTVDGTVKTTTSVNLSAATSFSNAAALISAAFTSGPVVAFDAQRQAFTFTSTTTGATSTVTFASGALAAPLFLTAATGAVTSQGSIASTPAGAMTAITAQVMNWATFMTTFEPVIADKIAFATWTSQQTNRFVYSVWDTDVNAGVSGNLTAFGPQLAALNLSGTVVNACDPAKATALGVSAASLVQPLAAFAMGYFASLDFGRTNGRTTAAYRSQGGLTPGVGDVTVYNNLVANGYNCYADVATSSQAFTFYQPGQISGSFDWMDSYANQIWFNSALQQAELNFIANAGSVPYNLDGYSAIETVAADPINAAINFGAIRTNVALSAAQIIAVNAAVGTPVDTVLSTRGWYLSVKDPGAVVRGQRGTPNCALYYTDGGSIQALSFTSTLIQ